MANGAGDDLERGATLGSGRFAVVGTLGAGGQGRTYEAIDKTTGVLVALKRFSVRGATSWKAVELAQREAEVLSSLEHPLLPRYISHFEEDGALYLAMERVEGRTLKELRAQRQFSQPEVVAFLNDAAETLSYLHSRAPAVIHRDIKPANVIRRSSGRYALVDFGSVAHVFNPEGGSTVVGTFGYMAPEQFQGRAMPASDLYSTAATALCMLTGQDPENLPHKGLGIDVHAALGPGVDARLRDLLVAALDPDPDARAKQPLQARLRAHGLQVAVGTQFEADASGSAREYANAEVPPSSDRRSRRAKSRRKDRKRQHSRSSSQRGDAPGGGGWQSQSQSARHSRRSGRAGFPSGPILLVVLIVLLLVRIATAALLGFILPTLLTVLSFAFGPGLKRAARRVALTSRRSQAALRRASEQVRQSFGPRLEVVETEGEDVTDQAESVRTQAPERRKRFRVEDLESELEEIAREIEEAAEGKHSKRR